MAARVTAMILPVLVCFLYSTEGNAGALYVEDADIDQAGSCKAQSWASLAGRYGFLGVTAAGCVLNIGRPIEFEIEFERERSGNDWGSEIGIEAKTALWKENNVAVAVQWGATFDLVRHRPASVLVRTPVSVEMTERLQLNFNVGWRYEQEDRLNWLLYGAGFQWKFAQSLALVGEIFGQAAQRDAEQPNATRPRAQLGVRSQREAQLGLRFALWQQHHRIGRPPDHAWSEVPSNRSERAARIFKVGQTDSIRHHRPAREAANCGGHPQ